MESKKLIKQLEDLKQATIVNYLSEIDLDSDMDLYDKLLYHMDNGDFDDLLVKNYSLDDNSKEKVLNLVHKYSSLCFFQGDITYWADSIEGVNLSDLDFVCLKLLDNFNFLVELAKTGNEDVLKQLVSFQKTEMASESAIIDYIRNNFYDDEILKKVLIEMSDKDGSYKDFNDYEKAILCTYPEGILYGVSEDGSVNQIPVEDLKDKLCSDSYVNDFSQIQEVFQNDINEFENAILRIYYDYHDDYNYRRFSQKHL